MPSFAVQIPCVAYSLVVIEAPTIDEAIAIVHAEHFDHEDEDSEPLYAMVQITAHQYKKAHAPGDSALAIARQAFEIDNPLFSYTDGGMMDDCTMCRKGIQPNKNGVHIIEHAATRPNIFTCPRLARLGAAVEAMPLDLCLRRLNTDAWEAGKADCELSVKVAGIRVQPEYCATPLEALQAGNDAGTK